MEEKEKTEQRKNWRLRWLNMLFGFSHLEYLKGLWLEHRYSNELGFFSEDICKYFDDLSIGDNYNRQTIDGYITNQELEIISSFHTSINNYEDKCKSDSEILEDPQWLSIVDEGSKAWSDLKKVIRDSEEIEYMGELEKRYIKE
jgi:hypothetical protein